MAVVQRVASGLSAFPADVLGPSGKQLEELELSRNEIGNVPAAISRLVSIRVIKLDCNCISVIPPEIGKLLQLQVLDLHSNLITSLPVQLAECRQLELLNLLDNPLTGPAPPDGERTFSMLYYGTAQQPDMDPEASDGFVRTATTRTLSFLRQYVEEPEPMQLQVESHPASSLDDAQGKARPTKSSSKVPVGGVMRKSDAIARLSRAMAAADPAKLRSAVAAAQAAGVTGSQVDAAAAAADCLDELTAATQSSDAGRLRNATSAWEHLLLPARPHGQPYLAARSALAVLAKKDTKPWRQPLTPQEVEAKKKQRAFEEEMKAHLDDRLLERQQAGESSFQAWLAHKADLKAREQQALHGFLRWQAETRQYSADIAYFEQQRLQERERAWPSRIVVPPSTPSFNVRVRAAHSVMASRVQSAQPSPPSSPVPAAQRSPPQLPAVYRRGPPSLAVAVPMRPSTSPQRSPWRASSASPGSANGRAQSAGLQAQRADMLKAGLPASVSPMVFSQHVSNAQSTGRSPRARALHARSVAKHAWSDEKVDENDAAETQLQQQAEEFDAMHGNEVDAANNHSIAAIKEETDEETPVDEDVETNAQRETPAVAAVHGSDTVQSQHDADEVRSQEGDEQEDRHQQVDEVADSDTENGPGQQAVQAVDGGGASDVGDEEDEVVEQDQQQLTGEESVAKQAEDTQAEDAVEDQYEEEPEENDENTNEVDAEYEAEGDIAEDTHVYDEQRSEYSEQPEQDDLISQHQQDIDEQGTEEDILAEVTDAQQEVSELETAEKDQQQSAIGNDNSEHAAEPAECDDDGSNEDQHESGEEQADEDGTEEQAKQAVCDEQSLPAENEDVTTQDEEVPLPPHYTPAPPPGERPKAPRRHDIADRPHTSHNAVRQASLDKRAPPSPNFGDLGPVAEKEPGAAEEQEEAVESADNGEEQDAATPERSAVLGQESEEEPDTMFIECGKNHGARVESNGPVLVALGAHVSAALPVMDAPKVAPGAVLATEELLAMKSIRILGSPASSDDEADDLLAVAQDELPASKLPQTAYTNRSETENDKDDQSEDAAAEQEACSEGDKEEEDDLSAAQAVEGDDAKQQTPDEEEQEQLADSENEQQQNDEEAAEPEDVAGQPHKQASIDCQEADAEQEQQSAEGNASELQEAGEQSQEKEDGVEDSQEEDRASHLSGSPATEASGLLPDDAAVADEACGEEQQECDGPITEAEPAAIEGEQQPDSQSAVDSLNTEEHEADVEQNQNGAEQDEVLADTEQHADDSERLEDVTEKGTTGNEEQQQQDFTPSGPEGDGLVENPSNDVDDAGAVEAASHPLEQCSGAEEHEPAHEVSDAAETNAPPLADEDDGVQNDGTDQVTNEQEQAEQENSTAPVPTAVDEEAADTLDTQESNQPEQETDTEHAAEGTEGGMPDDDGCAETAATSEPENVEAATEDVDGDIAADNGAVGEAESPDANDSQVDVTGDANNNEHQESMEQQAEEAPAEGQGQADAEDEVSADVDTEQQQDVDAPDGSDDAVAAEDAGSDEAVETGVQSEGDNAAKDTMDADCTAEDAAGHDDSEADGNPDSMQTPAEDDEASPNEEHVTDSEENAADVEDHGQAESLQDDHDTANIEGDTTAAEDD